MPLLVDPECKSIINLYRHRGIKRRNPSAWLAKDPMYHRSGSSFDLKSIREYQPSDDPRAIDWKLLARSGRTFVKEFYDEGNEGVAFLIDASASMNGFGSGKIFISSLAYILLGLGISIDIWAFSSGRLGSRLHLRGLGSHAGFAKALEDTGFSGRTQTNKAYRMLRAQCRLKRIFIFSDFHEQDFRPMVPRSGKLFMVRFYKPFSELAGNTSELEVIDPESKETVTLSWDRGYRNKLEAMEEARQEKLALSPGLFYMPIQESHRRTDFYYKTLDALYD